MNQSKQGGNALLLKAAIASTLATSALIGVMAWASPGHAANPAIVSLTDPELAQMRGKFLASNNRVMYFGVEMVSHWQTTSGTMTAGLNMGIDRSQGHPEVTFQPTVAIDGSPRTQTSGSHFVASGATNDSRGVRQQIQVAGNDNRANNSMEVVIQPYHGNGSTASGAPANYQVAVSRGGAVVASGLSASGRTAGVSMQLGNSLIHQRLQGGNTSQVIQLAGNQQAVHNQLRLLVGMDPSRSSAGPDQLHQQVARSLATLRGIR